MKYHEKKWSRVLVARTWPTTEVWLDWLTAVLNLDESKEWPCSLPKTGGSLLLTRRGAEAKTGQSDFVVASRESPG